MIYVRIRIFLITAMIILVCLSNLPAKTDRGSERSDRKRSVTRQTAVRQSSVSYGIHRQPSDPNSIRKTEKSLNYRRYGAPSGDESLSNRFPRFHAQIPHVAPDHVTTGTPQTFVVTSTADTGAGSFRKAIHDANANPGPDSIVFNISGGGTQTIKPTTFYEVITSPVVIDGTTQPGYVDHPVIEIDGENQSSQFPSGLEIDAQDVTIRGLAINRFLEGIIVDTSGGDVIEGNYIGTDPTGEISLPNIDFGITLSGPHNRIGGTTPGARNVIQGSWQNIEILGNDPSWLAFSHDNVIQGNIIGLDASGKTIINTAPQQTGGGALSLFGSYNDTIGGTVPGAGNIISGNLDGIYFGGYDHLQNTVPSYGSVIQGNFIGLDISGTVPLGNSQAGLTLYRSYGNLIGGTSSSARNIFTNNAQNGIRLITTITANNTIQGNYIGTDSSGTVLPSNASGNGEGIYSIYSHDNIIGGTSPGARNIISGNQDNGIFLDTMSENYQIEGNWVGLTPHQGNSLPAGNLFHGIVVNSAPRNIIGGTDPGAGNVIGANSFHGILVTGDSATGNVITGNFIGTDASEAPGLGNAVDGILIDGTKNKIGGNASGAANTVTDNGGVGIYILSGTDNRISQNSIYANDMLGIDIYPTGPNLNDSLDADVGPNNMQNFPVIDSVLHESPNTVIKGRLNSVPNNDFLVEFFENTSGDTSHYGEGETFIGSTNVTTDASGNGTFSYVGPSTPAYKVITATATDTAGNTSEFSRDLKAITITNPLGGELWITEEPDTIAWTFTGAFDSVTIGYSTDGGTTFQNISNAGSRQGHYIWYPPKGTLSKKCKISVEEKDNPDAADTSLLFKIKGYELTRDSADQYVRFEVGRHGWKFPNDSAHLWPSFWWSQFNYKTGIDPNTNQPYTEDIQLLAKPSNFPDWPLFVTTFGQNQCYFDPSKASYKPSVVTFWLNMIISDGKWGGSCFGLATSSFQAFDDQATFLNYFPGIGGFTQLYDLDTTVTIRRINNELWLSQLGNEPQAVLNQKWQLKPSETVNELRAMLLDENRDDKTLSIDNQILSGGHQVSPYKIEHDPLLGGNWFRIYIYDNNAPNNSNQFIEVDTAANYWNYNAFSSRGWGGSQGLYLMDPVSDYYSTFTLGAKAQPGIARRTTLQAGSNTMKILSSLGTGIAIVDASGDTLGYSDSVVTNKIPNGRPIIPKTGGFFPPIGYQMPTGDYSVTLSAFSDTTVHFAAFTDSSIFSFQRSGVQANETDHLKIGTGYDVINHDAKTKIANLQSIIIHSDNEKVLSLKNISMTQDDSVHMEVVNRQNLHVINTGDTLHYDLTLQYASAEGAINFKHTTLVVPGHGAVQIVPSWDSMAFSPAKILIDHTNSGTFDDSVSIDNQSIGWYPDSLNMAPNAITGGKPATGTVFLNAVAPHGGMLVNLSSSVPLYASVPSTIFIPVGQSGGSFTATTQIVAVPETVVISASANGITRRDTFYVLPQGIESLTLNPPGGVIGGDSATCTVTVSNPAPIGGTLITLTNGNPAIATLPSSVTVPQTAISKSFTVYTSHVQHTDSCIITASSGLRQASARLLVSPFGFLRIVPDTVTGGIGVTLYDSIAVPAPPGGLQFILKSSDTVTVWIPPYLYLGSGQVQTYASINTSGVGKDTVVTFSVTNAPYPLSTQLLVRPAGLASVSSYSQVGCFVGQHGAINMQTFIAGNPISFQVSLDGEAPPAGALIKLKSDQPSVLPVDSEIVVPYNNWNATGTVTSSDAVTSPQRVIVTLSFRGKSLYDTVTIFPRLHYRLIEFGDSTFNYVSMAINNAGQVLANSPSGLYFWQNGQVTLLSSYPGYHLDGYFAPSPMNDSGHIVGSSNSHAAYWRPDTTIVLGNPPGYTQSAGLLINNHDDIVGTADTSIIGLGEKACLWSGSAVTLLDDYGPVYHSYPNAINNSRQIVGNAVRNYYGYTFASAGLLWENAHITWSLPGWTIGAYNTPIIPSANVINDSGIIAGSYYIQPAYSGQGWFIRRGTDTFNLPTLPPYYGMSPLAINRSGVIVGNMWEDDAETSPAAFIYKDGYYYDMNCITDSLPMGREVAIANSINDQGVIAGAIRLLRYNTTRPCLLVPTGISLGVNDSRSKQLPVEYKLLQNYPNPFNPTTIIRYELPKASRVSLKVYNVLGQTVATIIDGVQQAGYQSVEWNGSAVASGVYFYRLEAMSVADPSKIFMSVKKMMLIR